MHIDPAKETFAAFRADSRPGPIHMLNLVRVRAEAAYPDNRKATGAEAYAACGNVTELSTAHFNLTRLRGLGFSVWKPQSLMRRQFRHFLT